VEKCYFKRWGGGKTLSFYKYRKYPKLIKKTQVNELKGRSYSLTFLATINWTT